MIFLIFTFVDHFFVVTVFQFSMPSIHLQPDSNCFVILCNILMYLLFINIDFFFIRMYILIALLISRFVSNSGHDLLPMIGQRFLTLIFSRAASHSVYFSCFLYVFFSWEFFPQTSSML